MYPAMRSSPSPHQAYAAAVDYGAQMPMMMAGGMYGPQGMPGYPQHMRSGRRDNGDAVAALRSPLLDEFRANKTRKWELKVSYSFFL